MVKTFGTLKWPIIIGLWFGILCLTIVIITYYNRRNHFPANISFHHILSIILALFAWSCNIFNLYETGYIHPIICYLEAILVNYGTLCVVAWTAIHSYNLHRYILSMKRAIHLKRNFRLYIIIGWILPIIPTIIGISIGNIHMLAMYCWIESPKILQFFSIYLYFFPAVIINLYWSITLAYKLRKAASEIGYRLRYSLVVRVIFGSALFSGVFITAAIALSIRVANGAKRDPQTIWIAELLGGVLGICWGLFYVTSPDVLKFYHNFFFGKKTSSNVYTSSKRKLRHNRMNTKNYYSDIIKYVSSPRQRGDDIESRDLIDKMYKYNSSIIRQTKYDDSTNDDDDDDDTKSSSNMDNITVIPPDLNSSSSESNSIELAAIIHKRKSMGLGALKLSVLEEEAVLEESRIMNEQSLSSSNNNNLDNRIEPSIVHSISRAVHDLVFPSTSSNHNNQ